MALVFKVERSRDGYQLKDFEVNALDLGPTVHISILDNAMEKCIDILAIKCTSTYYSSSLCSHICPYILKTFPRFNVVLQVGGVAKRMSKPRL